VKRIDVMTLEASSRREFCQNLCQAASVAALGVLLPGCGGGGNPAGPSGVTATALPVISGTVTNGTVALTIDSSSPLNAVGSAAIVQASGQLFLVGHTGQDAFTALTAICTHQNCTITGFAAPNYVCPCHGSQFSLTGKVVSGPAPRALSALAADFSGGVLTVTVG
jgi:nitrite reductase/ring-hydroxylating ferredoxin subunit